MTKLLGILATLSIIVIVTNFLPVVTELPFGMDAALVFFIGAVNALIAIMPWMEMPWILVMWALFIKGLLFLFHWSMFFVNLFAGGGSAPGSK